MSDYDVERQTFKHIAVALALGSVAFIVVGGWILWPAFEASLYDHGPVAGWFGMMSVVVLVGFAMFAVMMPVIQRQRALMDYSQQGYHVDWGFLPRKWFGTCEYDVRRTDNLTGFGMRIGGTPGARKRYERLRERAKRQREMPCEVCGTEVGNPDVESVFDREAYFIEHRRATYLFGVTVPFTKKLVDVEAYCVNHKPRDWDGENDR